MLVFQRVFFCEYLTCVFFFVTKLFRACPWKFETKTETMLRFLSFSFFEAFVEWGILGHSAVRWTHCKNASMTWAKDQGLSCQVLPSFALFFCFGRPIIRIEKIKIMYRDFAYNTVTIHFNISIYLIFSMQIIGFMVYKKGLEFR